MKPLRVSDAQGQRWLIFPGDPAWEGARKLHLAGVVEIVLPRGFIMYGNLTEVTLPARLEEWDMSNPALATLLRRYVRLSDCTAFLTDVMPER